MYNTSHPNNARRSKYSKLARTACDTCRRMKTRCDIQEGEQGTDGGLKCHRCSRLDLDCSYKDIHVRKTRSAAAAAAAREQAPSTSTPHIGSPISSTPQSSSSTSGSSPNAGSSTTSHTSTAASNVGDENMVDVQTDDDDEGTVPMPNPGLGSSLFCVDPYSDTRYKSIKAFNTGFGPLIKVHFGSGAGPVIQGAEGIWAFLDPDNKLDWRAPLVALNQVSRAPQSNSQHTHNAGAGALSSLTVDEIVTPNQKSCLLEMWVDSLL